MKREVTVWTLAWDTKDGTDCKVFASEGELNEFFRRRILSETAEVDPAFANKINALFDARFVGDAYSLWQESYKSELDTYNWDAQRLSLEIPQH